MPRKPADFKPEATFPPGHEKEGQARCQAWARTRGEQCSNNPVDGSDCCRMHGGKSRKGAAHPNFKTGERSRYLPNVLQDIYKERAADPQLLQLHHEATILDARITQCLQALDDYAGVNYYQKLRRIVGQMRSAQAEDQRRKLLAGLLRTIERGSSEAQAWEDIRRYIDDKRKLVKDENQRRLKMGEMYTQEDIDNYQTTLFVIINEAMQHVPDRKAILQTVHEKLARALSERVPGEG